MNLDWGEPSVMSPHRCVNNMSVYAGTLFLVGGIVGCVKGRSWATGFKCSGLFGNVGCVYGLLEGGVYGMRGTNPDVKDVTNCSLAGLGTGALYHVCDHCICGGPKPASLKPVAAAAAIGALTAAGIVTVFNKSKLKSSDAPETAVAQRSKW